MPTSIRKVLYPRSGGPEVVQVIEDILPDPGKGELQAKVIYSGFGGSDMNMRNNTYPMQKGFPLSPGYCFVGRVTVNGPESSKYQPGDLVCCLTKYESEATYINIPEKYAIGVPSDLDLQAACALVLDWTTAYGMVHRSGDVQANDKVFIHGMSGAVGQALFALCKLRGAVIYGTASTSKHEQLTAKGAEGVFDYRDKKWIDAMLEVGGANVVFDPLGFQSYDESFSILERDEKGILIGYGGNAQTLGEGQQQQSQWMSTGKLLMKNLCWSNRSAKFFYVDRDQKTFVPELQELFHLLSSGKIEVPIKKVFPLDDVPAIHAQWNKLEGIGSCLVQIGE